MSPRQKTRGHESRVTVDVASAEGHHTRMVLTPHQARVIAVKAGCDPRTVRKFLTRSERLTALERRIQDALRELGFDTDPGKP